MLARTFAFAIALAAAMELCQAKAGQMTEEQFRKIVEAVRAEHLMPAPDEPLDEWRLATAGFLSRYDPHTRYLPPDELRRKLEFWDGAPIAGIGMVGAMPPSDGAGLDVADLVPGGPAERAGLRIGDRIGLANGSPLAGMIDERAALIRGPAGSEIKLAVRRGESSMELVATRGEISFRSAAEGIFGMPDGRRILFLRIGEFTPATPMELARAARRGIGNVLPDGIVLDLRGNPGGSVEAAIRTASAFMEPGAEIVSVEARGRAPETYRAGPAISGPPIIGLSGRSAIPMAVLVDSSTASASEIVAAALRDSGRAAIVGERTYGKGSVQEIRRIPGAGGLLMTVALYRSPSGRLIQSRGIEPDIRATSQDRPAPGDGRLREESRAGAIPADGPPMQADGGAEDHPYLRMQSYGPARSDGTLDAASAAAVASLFPALPAASGDPL